MPTIKYNNESFECSKAIRGVDYIKLLDSAGNEICLFGGIHDFSMFEIADGDWSAPGGYEEIRASAYLSNGTLIIAAPGEVGNGTLIKFKAPCDCAAVTNGLVINDKEYICVNATGVVVTGTEFGGVWSAGAMLAIIVDVEACVAYMQSSDTGTQALVQLNSSSIEDFCKIGDTVNTLRTDLGDGWLLCNGEPITRYTYPRLFEMLTGDAVDIISLGDATIIGVATNGVTYVFITHSTVYVTEDFVTFSSYTIDATDSLECVGYSQGTWCILGQTAGSDDSYYISAYTASDPHGSWTRTNNVFTAVSPSNYKLIAEGGRWLLRIEQDTEHYVGLTSDPAGTWTFSSLESDTMSFAYASDIAYGDGKFVAVASGYWSSTSNPRLHIRYSTHGTSWTKKTIAMDTTSIYHVAITYNAAMDTWVLAYKGTVYTLGSLLSYPQLVATDLTYYDYSSPNHFAIYSTQSDGLLLVTSTNSTSTRLMLSDDLTSWCYDDSLSSFKSYSSILHDGNLIITSDSKLCTSAARSLPTISVGDVYTYIKAK